MTLHDIWTYSGPFVGGLVALWGFLKLSPATFIERGFGHYLETKLEGIKRDHTVEIEALKYEYGKQIAALNSSLSHLADRGIRSNEREYEALTVAWGKFMDAFYATRRCVGGFESMPNFQQMTNTEIEYMLDSIDVKAVWRKKIMDSTDRQATYMRMREFDTIDEAGNSVAALQDTVRRQSVFIPVELNEKLETAILMLRRVQSACRISMQIGKPVQPELGIDLVGAIGETMFADIRSAVRDRLLRNDAPSGSAGDSDRAQLS